MALLLPEIGAELWEAMTFGDVVTDIAEADWATAGRGIINNPKGSAAVTAVFGAPNIVQAGISQLGEKPKGGMSRKRDPSPWSRDGRLHRRINTGNSSHEPGQRDLPIPILDGDITEIRDQSTQTDSIEMSKGGADGEVPVAPVPRAISKIHPDHFNIRLPFVWRANILNTACTSSHDEPVVLIRLNSIYDCLKEKNTRIDYQVNPNSELATVALTAANANDPVAAAIVRTGIDQTAVFNPSSGSGAGGPQGRNIWQAHFKYYRVIRSDVKITYFNKNCEMTSDTGSAPANVGPLRNHYVCGFELVDEDAQLSDTVEMFLMTKNAQRGILPPAEGGAYQISGAGISYPYCRKASHAVMNYTYDPNYWDYHVEQTSGVETRWTAIGSNPALNHLLAVRMFHLDTSDQSFGTWYNLGCMVQIEYEVQFMECLDSFYKTQYRPTATNS